MDLYKLGGGGIAISSCFPTFPRNKRNTKYNKKNTQS